MICNTDYSVVAWVHGIIIVILTKCEWYLKYEWENPERMEKGLNLRTLANNSTFQQAAQQWKGEAQWLTQGMEILVQNQLWQFDSGPVPALL